MTYPYVTRGLPSGAGGQRPSLAAERIPTLGRAKMDDPKSYMPHKDLTHALNVSLVLGMPLLVTGEPGTGKTQLAYAVADEIGAEVLRFDTKSTSQARDLFYVYDAVSAFKMRAETDQRAFITYQALGQAILDAFEPQHPRIRELTENSTFRHRGPRRSVVLIDEIDKAPRDFPNDLLNEIDRLSFRVPELRNIGSPGSDHGEAGLDPSRRPIVIMTSNSEKGLPDAFLRRCVYFDIPFPTESEMSAIVARRVEGLNSSAPLLSDALDFFYRLRRGGHGVALRKEPSTAELLNWLEILRHRGLRPESRLVENKPLVLETLSVLVKTSEDRRVALDFAERALSR